MSIFNDFAHIPLEDTRYPTPDRTAKKGTEILKLFVRGTGMYIPGFCEIMLLLMLCATNMVRCFQVQEYLPKHCKHI